MALMIMKCNHDKPEKWSISCLLQSPPWTRNESVNIVQRPLVQGTKHSPFHANFINLKDEWNYFYRTLFGLNLIFWFLIVNTKRKEKRKQKRKIKIRGNFCSSNLCCIISKFKTFWDRILSAKTKHTRCIN